MPDRDRIPLGGTAGYRQREHDHGDVLQDKHGAQSMGHQLTPPPHMERDALENNNTNNTNNASWYHQRQGVRRVTAQRARVVQVQLLESFPQPADLVRVDCNGERDLKVFNDVWIL